MRFQYFLTWIGRFAYLVKLLNPSHLSLNHPDNLEHERDDNDARRHGAEDDACPAQRCLHAVPGTGGEVQAPGLSNKGGGSGREPHTVS